MKYSDLQIAFLYNYALFMLQLVENEYYNGLYKWIAKKTMYTICFVHHLVYNYDYQEALFISLYALCKENGFGLH